jgi:hypothetical protein
VKRRGTEAIDAGTCIEDGSSRDLPQAVRALLALRCVGHVRGGGTRTTIQPLTIWPLLPLALLSKAREGQRHRRIGRSILAGRAFHLSSTGIATTRPLSSWTPRLSHCYLFLHPLLRRRYSVTMGTVRVAVIEQHAPSLLFIFLFTALLKLAVLLCRVGRTVRLLLVTSAALYAR